MSEERQLFVFWQFNGNNQSYCNLRCPECYGRDGKTYLHYWNGQVEKWEKAFERLNRDIYFVMSYGEALGSKGFYECVDIIGRHPNWTLCIVTNLMLSPKKLLESKLAKDNRLFIVASWHPEGVDDRVKGWEVFKQHVLMLKAAGIKTHVMYCWHPDFIGWYPEYFEWLDANDIRAGVRRFVRAKYPFQHVLRRVWPKFFAGKILLSNYSAGQKGFIYAYTGPKVTKYGLDLACTYGKKCSAGKDLILVEHDGTVKLCADCCGKNHRLGNIFDPEYRLNADFTRCPTNSCGGDYGMPHLVDDDFGPLPKRLWNDTFVSQIEDLPEGSPVPYHKRNEMKKYLEMIKCERQLF